MIGHDSLSTYYFEQDGFSFCGSRTIVLDQAPFYVSASDSMEPVIIAKSDHFLDPITTN